MKIYQDYILSCNLPFSHVEKDGFKVFMSRMAPQEKVPTKKTVFGQYYSMRVEKKENELIKLARDCKMLGLASDYYTAITAEKLYALISYFYFDGSPWFKK